MGKLLIVSNRLPLSVEKKRGKLYFYPSIGGLATGLSSFYREKKALWIGWPGVSTDKISVEEKVEIEERLFTDNCLPVFLTSKEVERFYAGFSNRTIWPLFHYFYQYAQFRKEYFEAYRLVNEKFCDVIMGVAKPDDTIWIHDYQLMLLPELLRKKIPSATIGFFLHIPFPSFEVFRLLPWRREILDGLLGADLVGFHTFGYARHFLSSVLRIMGYDNTLGRINLKNRVVIVDVFPMGIDFDRFNKVGENKEVQSEVEKIKGNLKAEKIIISIDRLDYTKGIIERLEAFDEFLKRFKEYRERVSMILITAPSRSGLEHYQYLEKRVNELVGSINGRHGKVGWMPVWYIHRSIPFENIAALYLVADVALVTPLRDGMNLIAKEFVASKKDKRGVLVLSEMAGAAMELGEAIIVNPNSREEMVSAIKQALEMSLDEQVERMARMQERLKRYNIIHWAEDFTKKLEEARNINTELRSRRLTKDIESKLIEDFSSGEKRLLLLDYDGTLVPFNVRPERAGPDRELLSIIETLSSIKGVCLVISSGRDRQTLDRWFGRFNIGIIAEHGVWVKKSRDTWKEFIPLNQDWKKEIMPVLEIFTDRTPGSFIEEKEFSLVWHYRGAEPGLADVRANELKDELITLISNLELEVLEGNKVIEIKSAGIDKGKASLLWVEEGWDFLLAAGDDNTDEDIFAVLPETAYTIKVGHGLSKARYRVNSYLEIRGILRKIIGACASADKLIN